MESLLDVDTYCRFLTFAVFVLAGFDFSRNIPKPKAQYSVVAFVLVATALIYLATQGRFISVVDFDVYINEIALGLSVGLVVGIIHRVRPRFKIRS